jgi:hypothetical protein
MLFFEVSKNKRHENLKCRHIEILSRNLMYGRDFKLNRDKPLKMLNT